MKAKFTLMAIICVLGMVVFFLSAEVFLQHRALVKIKTGNFPPAIEKEQSIQQKSSDAPEPPEDAVDPLAEATKAASGIYEYDLPYNQGYWQLDLRSDKTGIFYEKFMSGNDSKQPMNVNWKFSTDNLKVGDNLNIKIGSAIYKIEGDDLIDSNGNRWLHIR
jgi:hypothetical protein